MRLEFKELDSTSNPSQVGQLKVMLSLLNRVRTIARPTFRLINISACAALVGVVAGCASSAPPVAVDATPAADHAYIAGRYEQNAGFQTMAFLLRNVETEDTYLIPFSHESSTSVATTETSLIEVPPGTYALVSWRGIARLTNATTFPRPVDPKLVSFEAKAGEVAFLGKFSGEYLRTNMFDIGVWQWHEAPISNTEARRLLDMAYPKFASAGLRCIRCVDAESTSRSLLWDRNAPVITVVPMYLPR